MDFTEAKDAILGFFACGFFSVIVFLLDRLVKSVQELNERLGLVILRQDLIERDHGRRIEHLEEKIS